MLRWRHPLRFVAMETITNRGLAFFAAAIAAFAMTGAPARAQEAACQIARAELAAHERSGGAVTSRMQRRGEIERLVAYYHAAGCGVAPFPFFGGPPPQCRQIEARIAQVQAGAAGSDNSSRRAQLAAAVERHCNPASPLAASSRGYGERDYSRSRIVIDEDEQPRPPEQSRPLALGRAMCVRSCDGYYFPLSASPGGREGADEMCQALCPATETRAYFLDKGGIDSATNGDGARYASLRNAYRFRREISATCGCRKPGETWSSALRRAEELITPESGDVVINDSNRDQPGGMALRPSTGPDAPAARRPARRLQSIDPEPEPLELEQEIFPPEPSGVAVMTPRAAPEPEAPVVAPPPTGGPRKPPRIVGPGVNADVGRPTPLPKAN